MTSRSLHALRVTAQHVGEVGAGGRGEAKHRSLWSVGTRRWVELCSKESGGDLVLADKRGGGGRGMVVMAGGKFSG
jgi:hypothetical protein